MSQEQEHNVLPPVLTASVHDVRYLVALLRGVNIANRANVTIAEDGLIIIVEDSRTLLGSAYIFSKLFDEYIFNPETPRAPLPPRAQPHRVSKTKKQKQKKAEAASSIGADGLFLSETESESEDDVAMDKDWQDSQPPPRRAKASADGMDEDEEQPPTTEFEIPLNTLVECLNIFGTAGPSTGALVVSSSEDTDGKGGGGGRGGGRGSGQGRSWRRINDEDPEDAEDPGERRRGGLDSYFGNGTPEKRTGMRLSYPGAGEPLTLIIAEDASGPTTTCKISTFVPEPRFELEFGNSETTLKVILKSSWLRDALSEVDPSCDKLTFIGHPPALPEAEGPDTNAKQRQHQRKETTPRTMLRIQATGALGSTEMDYPNFKDVFEAFECTKVVSVSYRFAHIARTLRALQSSTKTALRINEDGVLSMQFIMPAQKPKAEVDQTDAFIEFRCLPLDEDI